MKKGQSKQTNPAFTLIEGQSVLLPLQVLRPAQGGENVRTVKTSKKADEQLKASIKAVGILKNLLIGVEPDDDGRFPIYGGQRRYSRAMELLAEGNWPEDRLVLCTPKKREDAEMLSAMENMHEPMHPADEFMAYKAMVDQGKTIEEIASAFGVSVGNVKKLLRLSSVAPVIVEAFRDEKMSLDAVIAFAITTDQEKQVACYEAIKRKGFRAWDIRSYLTNNYLEGSDTIVKFVGLQQYKKAGGVTNADLFSKTVYLHDPNLVETLAKQKLGAMLAEINEQWKWFDIAMDEHDARQMGRRLSGEYVNVPQELEAEIAGAEAELEELTDKDFDEVTDEDDEKIEALEKKIEELNEKRETFRDYNADQRSYAGCVVCIGENGNPKIVRGVVRKEDEPARNKGRQGEEAGEGGLLGQTEEKSVESNVLKQDLATYRLQAFQATLMGHESLMQDLLVFTLAIDVLGHFQFYSSLKATASRFKGVDIEKTRAARIIDEAKDALSLGWLAEPYEAEQLAAFIQLNATEKRKIMAFCVASTMNAPSPHREDDVMSWVAGQIDFRTSDLWAPTVNNYFGRIPKHALLAIGGERIGADWVKSNASQKKGLVAEQLSGEDQMVGWFPESMLK